MTPNGLERIALHRIDKDSSPFPEIEILLPLQPLLLHTRRVFIP
jgi:hypothetical protein